MGDFLKSIGGLIIALAVLLGIGFIALFFIKGGVWLGVKILPWLSIIMWVVFAVDLIVVLPLGIFRRTRGASGIGLVISSYVYGLTLWLSGLLLAYLIWGAVAVFIGLFLAGVGVVPVAMLATAIEGEWSITGQLVLLTVMTFGARGLGLFFCASGSDRYEPEDYATGI
jgi:hypothetical protein